MKMKKVLIKVLEENNYIDGSDIDLNISLFEYGSIRNPKTGDVLYYFNRHFDWTTVTIDDVIEALNELNGGFFDFIGSTKEDELLNLDNDHLIFIINSLNTYNGYFQQSCNWDLTIEDAILRLKN